MSLLFVDTAGWMACADEADPHHDASTHSRDQWLAQGGILVTTDYVVDETLTLLRFRLHLKAAKDWWEKISSSRRVRIESLDTPILEMSRRLFFGYSDKDFSFTDCTSFALMKKLKLHKALTTDHHFTQAGYQIVPAASAL